VNVRKRDKGKKQDKKRRGKDKNKGQRTRTGTRDKGQGTRHKGQVINKMAHEIHGSKIKCPARDNNLMATQ
jgi:hypothetical protein